MEALPISLDRPRAPRAWYVVAAAVTLLLAYLTRAPSLTDWDSWEYAAQAVNGTCSGLCLGRWWFAFAMRQAWHVGQFFGADLLHSYQPMRIAVALTAAGGVAALMHWTFVLTGRRLATALAAAMAVASGALMSYASTVMTEAPTLLLVMLAYLWWERAVQTAGQLNKTNPDLSDGAPPRPFTSALYALAAGLAFGVAANIREPVLFLCVFPIVSCFLDRPRHRWRLLALAVVGAVLMVAFAVWQACIIRGQDPMIWLRDYGEYMRLERSTYGWGKAANLVYLLMHIETASPLLVSAAVAFVLWLIWGGGRGSAELACLRGPGGVGGRRLAAIALCTLPYCLMTWYNPDLSFNYRLTLPLVWVLIPPAAAMGEAVMKSVFLGRPRKPWSLAKKLTVVPLTMLAFGQVLVISGILMCVHRGYSNWQAELFQNLQEMPPNSTVVPGPGVPVMLYLERTGLRPELNQIKPDFFTTAQNMRERMQAELQKGRRVFVNLEDRNQRRPDGNGFEYEATVEASKAFNHRPGPGPFVEMLAK